MYTHISIFKNSLKLNSCEKKLNQPWFAASPAEYLNARLSTGGITGNIDIFTLHLQPISVYQLQTHTTNSKSEMKQMEMGQ